ncbi:isoprenoid synthase domain-containing protein [Xylariaceae sp. FL1019]|nr:isoprenoid synthase domain-containing protein [Xylariaceae sp. FL1019]
MHLQPVQVDMFVSNHDLLPAPIPAVTKPPKDVGRVLKPLLAHFTAALGYTGARVGDDLHGLLKAMNDEAFRIGIPYAEGSRSWFAFEVGVYYAQLCYPSHPLEIRVYTGIFTWLAVLVDDGASKDPEEWQQFLPRFYSACPQTSLVAQSWADCLRLSYRYYSPIVANFIITSALNFVNANALEGSEIPRMERTRGGESWPYYLRDKDGISEAYVWLTFPDVLYPDVSCYMEAIPDMNKYISFTNDIMSFYKEECAGEEDNYMHNRAFYERKGVMEVFRQVIKENVDTHNRIQLVLEGKEPYRQAWNEHAMGFVAMHKAVDRYRLKELGMGETFLMSM